MSLQRARICRLLLNSKDGLQSSDIAHALDVSKQALSSDLLGLQSMGAIRREGSMVYVKDRAQLTGLTGTPTEPPEPEAPAEPPKVPTLAQIVRPRRSRRPDFNFDPDAMVIESGIPIPGGSGKHASLNFPFDRMKVGDSFKVDLEHGASAQAVASSIRNSAVRYRKQHPGFGLTVRSDPQGRFVRAWRVAEPPRQSKQAA